MLRTYFIAVEKKVYINVPIAFYINTFKKKLIFVFVVKNFFTSMMIMIAAESILIIPMHVC